METGGRENGWKEAFRGGFPAAVALGMVLSAACAPPAPHAPAPPVESAMHRAAEVRALESLVNEHRRQAGCAPLRLHDGATRVAQRHSEDMARRNFFSHQNPDGESPFDRLHEGGISFRAAAENIAYGQRDAQAVMASWVSSAGHRRNIENCAYTHHGAGLFAARWTHLLLTP